MGVIAFLVRSATTAVLALAACALLSLLPARATASRAPAEVLRAE